MNIRLIAAMTLDGKIAKNSSHFTDWTSPEDKDFLHARLDESDCVIVGSNTYKTAYEPLSKRNCIVFTRSVAETKQENRRLLYVNPQRVDVVKLLAEQKYATVDLLGGTQVYSWFLEKNLIDEIYLTVEPVIFGSGLSLFDSALPDLVRYELVSVTRLNEQGSVSLYYKKKLVV